MAISRGITLTELLVVVAIVAIITAIISPSLIHAKKSAMGSVNAAQLRQAGVAHGIYTADFGDTLPDTRTLVTAGYLDQELLADPLDKTSEGMMNCYRTRKAGGLISEPVGYFDSYLNVNEHLGQILIERLDEIDPNYGWLVAPYLSEPAWSKYPCSILIGTYKRLRMDGSVITRQHRFVPEELSVTGSDRAQSNHSYFSDLDDYGTFGSEQEN
ncbi:MAG: prepilin-type N-terminal cleavage/methylation domain-containing protein [Fimbriimonadaceae bacterium]